MLHTGVKAFNVNFCKKKNTENQGFNVSPKKNLIKVGLYAH